MFLDKELTIPLLESNDYFVKWIEMNHENETFETHSVLIQRVEVMMQSVNLWRNMLQRYMPCTAEGVIIRSVSESEGDAEDVEMEEDGVHASESSSEDEEEDNDSNNEVAIEDLMCDSGQLQLYPSPTYNCLLSPSSYVLFTAKLLSAIYQKLNEIWHYKFIAPCLYEEILMSLYDEESCYQIYKDTWASKLKSMIDINKTIHQKIIKVVKTLELQWWTECVLSNNETVMIDNALAILGVALDSAFNGIMLRRYSHHHYGKESLSNKDVDLTLMRESVKIDSWLPLLEIIKDLNYSCQLLTIPSRDSAPILQYSATFDEFPQIDFNPNYSWVMRPFHELEKISLFIERIFNSSEMKYEILAISSADVKLETKQVLIQNFLFWFGSLCKLLLLRCSNEEMSSKETIAALRTIAAQNLEVIQESVISWVNDQHKEIHTVTNKMQNIFQSFLEAKIRIESEIDSLLLVERDS
jgi:hypothetical protein